ncbi:MAG: nitrate reductase cytochrome c-type subunit; periplasmic nitrate reductase electron transfer subunit [Gammaproteobacteria bacterium]|nr:nitrate reductase cytochrome c-type subunit; periplasmic nitrate reductase electron transfer subunit [Gammaproteobacteria bacterium]
MKMRSFIIATGFLIAATHLVCAAEQNIATLRNAPLDYTPKAPRMTPQYNKDLRQVRNYPEQPPLIPHKSEHYQIDMRINQCLGCHRRTAVGQSQAPMLSITHFMDRDGQFLASVSPRRYFCNQCHVSQHETEPLVGNTFVDIDSLLLKTK